MKNRIKKIRAFTLSEMIVVLIITTIVVGMAFAVLNLVQRQMHGIEKNYERNTELNRLRQSFWIDFNRSEAVYYDGTKGQLRFVNGMETQKYIISGNLIIREMDTFRLQWEEQRFLFQNKERTSGEIDAITFRTGKEYGNRQLFIYKRNSATSFMQ